MHAAVAGGQRAARAGVRRMGKPAQREFDAGVQRVLPVAGVLLLQVRHQATEAAVVITPRRATSGASSTRARRAG